MGVVERKERQRLELRGRILDAAGRIVVAEGLEGLTMRKIADAIEYSPATIYLHFPSRDAIALQLVRDGFEELLRYLAPAAEIGDPVERLRAIGAAYLRFGREKPQAYRLVFMTDPKLSAVIANYAGSHNGDGAGDRAFNLLASTVRELIERGIFKPLDPLIAAHCCWAALHGIVSLNITCDAMTPRDDVDAIARTMLDALVDGMR